MVSRVACERSDFVSAAVQVAGAAPSGFEQTCQPTRAIPISIMYGLADPIVPYAGGPIAAINGASRGAAGSADAYRALWARMSGCSSLGVAVPVAPASKVSMIRPTGCSGPAVVGINVEGGGHEWFNQPGISASGWTWRFLTGTGALRESVS
jgi:polyhydroxybutyrate depolymerase